MANHRIVFLGQDGVGKSSIIRTFTKGIYTKKHERILTECFQHVVKLTNGHYRHIEIMDTDSVNEFPVMRDLFIRQGQAFAVVYAVDDEDSFSSAIEMCNLIYQIKGSHEKNVVLVGNKMDVNSEGRLISTENGADTASRTLKCAFLETSAKLDFNVQSVFRELLPTISTHRDKMERSQSLRHIKLTNLLKKWKNYTHPWRNTRKRKS